MPATGAGSLIDAGGHAGRGARPRILYIINEAYFLLSHRSELLQEAIARFETVVAAPSDHVWAPEGFSTNQIEAMGARFVPIAMNRRGQNPMQEIGTLRSIARVIRQTRPDVLHLLTIKANVYGGVLARLMRVPAVVFSVTGLGHVFVARGLFAWLRRTLVGLALRLAFGHPRAYVVVQNADDLRYLVKHGIVEPRRAVLIRGAGVDIRRFQATPEPAGPVTILFAGRLLWDKGVGTFVEASRLLGGCSPQLRFVVVGDTKSSNPRSVPAATLEQWVAEGLIEWWGRRTDMPAVLASGHVFCFPSSYGEGVPKVLLEAAAAGRPVVASDIAGCREVVQPGETGLLVPAADAKPLAAALNVLIQDSGARQRMGRAARSVAEREFDVVGVVEKTAGLYDALLAEDARSPHPPGRERT